MQSLHHFLRDAVGDVQQVRATRLHIIQQVIGVRPITPCIDETGDVKKGSATDYGEAVRRQLGTSCQRHSFCSCL